MNKFLKIIFGVIVLAGLCLALFYYEIYVPKEIGSVKSFYFTAQRGQGDDEIAFDLEKNNIINSNYFFRLYDFITGKGAKLKAGKYILSSGMSVAQIVDKFVRGDVVRDNITIIEGWDLTDLKKYFLSKNFCNENNFFETVKNDFNQKFAFLNDKPENLSLEGYIFPDTYQVALKDNCESIIKKTLANLDKKLTLDLRAEIIKQKKSIFDIITMASIIEKEVTTQDDKKMVSGILWKRIALGMPLQVDATINYITKKDDASVLIIDTKINSPYNTYKYAGLPKGPISSPGIDSIVAAIYPKQSQFLFYLSTKDGKTIFSKTLAEHNLAIYKYLR